MHYDPAMRLAALDKAIAYCVNSGDPEVMKRVRSFFLFINGTDPLIDRPLDTLEEDEDPWEVIMREIEEEGKSMEDALDQSNVVPFDEYLDQTYGWGQEDWHEGPIDG